MMINSTKLQVQIKLLKEENALLRTALKEIIDTAYQAINQEPAKGGNNE
jgi:hypothetical protein